MAGHLWLVGMMGSGKSTVGRALAERLDRPFIDTDDVVVRRVGCSIAEFWGQQGEQAFRQMESAAVAELALQKPRVIATGGGAVLDEANVTTMRDSGIVIWLQASPDTLASRVSGNSRRPLLADAPVAERLGEILQERHELYEAAAHHTVTTDDIAQATIVDRIEELWNAY